MNRGIDSVRRMAEFGLTSGNKSIIVSLDELLATIGLEDACKAALMFHDGEAWSISRQREWLELTGKESATTKTLCDFIRECLAKAKGTP